MWNILIVCEFFRLSVLLLLTAPIFHVHFLLCVIVRTFGYVYQQCPYNNTVFQGYMIYKTVSFLQLR
jgi:hypothetical protein